MFVRKSLMLIIVLISLFFINFSYANEWDGGDGAAFVQANTSSDRTLGTVMFSIHNEPSGNKMVVKLTAFNNNFKNNRITIGIEPLYRQPQLSDTYSFGGSAEKNIERDWSRYEFTLNLDCPDDKKFITNLQQGKRLTVLATMDSKRREIEFTLKGARQAIQRVLDNR